MRTLIFGISLYLTMALIVMMFIMITVAMLPRFMKFRGSKYSIASGNSFIKTAFNKGNYGEFLTFDILDKLEGHNRIMTNLYVPKEDGTTTEIDLIMISRTGIYVFESKNYSGWIFGDEKQKNWTQSLHNRQKNRFYNPIWQNKGHITALKQVVGIDDEASYKSYIVFSDRCTLKKINVDSKNVKVIKRNSLFDQITSEIREGVRVLSLDQVDDIYSKLGEFILADDERKQAHINEVNLKKTIKEVEG